MAEIAKKDEPEPGEHGATAPDPSHGLKAASEIEAVVNPRVLELMVCPLTRGPLSYVRDQKLLVSRRPKVAYQIINGVAILVPDEAEELADDDPLLKR